MSRISRPDTTIEATTMRDSSALPPSATLTTSSGSKIIRGTRSSKSCVAAPSARAGGGASCGSYLPAGGAAPGAMSQR